MKANSNFESFISLLEDSLNNFNSFCGKKEDFVNSDDSLSIAISLFKQIYIYTFDHANDCLFISKKMMDFQKKVTSYNSSLFDSFGLVNGYKLYDFFAVDLINLHKELKEIAQ